MKNFIKFCTIFMIFTTLIQTDDSQVKWLTEEINRYNEQLSANITFSDQELTLEMPDCAEPTYIYLRNNNQYQRILLTPTKNTETIHLLKSPNIAVFIAPEKHVENYIRCRQENIKLLTAQAEATTKSNVEDARPAIKQAKEKFKQGALKECGNIKEIFVTNITVHDAPKHIILPTYQEILDFHNNQIIKNQDYQKAHPYHGQTMELYIPEQTLKFSIKQSNS